MTDLPAITVTSAQSTRILDAYKGHYGVTTKAEAEEAYVHDVTKHINRFVIEYEDSLLVQQQHNERAAKMTETAEKLPKPKHPKEEKEDKRPPEPGSTPPPPTPPLVPPDSLPPVPEDTLPDAVVEVTK